MYLISGRAGFDLAETRTAGAQLRKHGCRSTRTNAGKGANLIHKTVFLILDAGDGRAVDTMSKGAARVERMGIDEVGRLKVVGDDIPDEAVEWHHVL